MNQPNGHPLVCPVCRAALEQQERCYCCPEGHSFDLARQGYLNLLLSHQRRSKHPGDSKEMIKARQTFLNEGHYLPIYSALEQLVLKHIKKDEHSQTLQITDLACGEGYYTHLLYKKLQQKLLENKQTEEAPRIQTWGLDISKDAIISACKHYPSVNWLVGNLAHTPFCDHSMDILTALFCPVSENELVRLLKPGATFIMAKPDAGHLIQLKEQLYSEIKGKDNEEEIEGSKRHPVHHPELELIDTLQVQHTFTLDKPELIQALFKMTPHFWRTKAEQQEKIMQLKTLETDISVSLYCYRLRTDSA